MKLISIVTPCYNEEENVYEVYSQVKRIFQNLQDYSYEHIFIDNASKDKTVDILKKIAAEDKNIKVIVNTRNFGVYRSPIHAMFQTKGDAVIPLAADLQDPPNLIPEFLANWEQGYKIVAAVKKESEESMPMYTVRKIYYNLISYLSETEQIKNYTGYGLFDRTVIELVRNTGDYFPYFRGLVCEMGYDIAKIDYVRPTRKTGITKNSLYDLYSQAMNGIVNQSKFPLRLATFIGFTVALFSILVAFGYFIYKLLYWQSFKVGTAPLVIGLFFFSAVQLIFLGIIGEYIGAIHSRIFQRWLVIEKERINFDD